MSAADKRPRSLLSRLRRNQEGAAILEFALILPFLMIVTIGLIDIGRMVWYRTTLAHIAREGTRYAAVHGASNPFPVTEQQVETYIVNRTVGISSNDLGIDVNWAPNNSSGSTVTINVTYNFNFFITGFLPLDPMQLRGASSMIVS